MANPALSEMTETAVRAASARVWRLGSGAKLGALTAAMALTACAAQVPWLQAGIPPITPHLGPVLVLCLLFAVAEKFVIAIPVRRGSHAMSLSEIPLVLGLVMINPLLLVAVRVAAAVVGLALFRRQRGLKLVFNVALYAVEATVAAGVFSLMVGSSDLLGPRGWVAAFAATYVTDVVSIVLVTTAIALRDDTEEWRRLVTADIRSLFQLPFVAVTTTLALVTAMVVRDHPRGAVLLSVLSFAAYRAFRRYAQQTQGHAQVEGLYAFTRALGGSSLDSGEVVRVVLSSARDQLRAGTAELMLPGEPMVRTRLSGRADLEGSLLDEAPDQTWWAAALRGEPVLLPLGMRDDALSGPVDGMAVPVTIDEATGVLILTDSLSDIPTFGEDDIRLFRALANHAGVALTKARLVDQLRREAAQKEHLALHDPLTELPNRRQFHRLLTEALSSQEPGRITVVMLMDLDRFKEINDALGHDVGDDVLVEVGTRLQRRLGARGVVARLGGDEFAVMLPRVSSGADALAVADDLNRELAPAIQLGDLRLNTKASIGIALAPEHGDATKSLLQHADIAMYAAKGTVEGIRLYDPADDRNTPRRLALIADLRDAIERRELRVVFQPKTDVRSGAAVGAEALARWEHPEYGVIPPDEFIPIAEHTGMIRGLTLHVLEVALRECATWRSSGYELSVAVNVSPSGLLDTIFPDDVARLLTQAGVPAHALVLEITETGIMSDPARVRVVLDRLNALGVQLSIDDFGTGYSSLGRLRELPIHEVKIDRSFVRDLASNQSDQAVVRSAIQLGCALGLRVVAEGVEDEETLAYLRHENCDLVQGYFVCRPVPAAQFAEWLHASPRTVSASRHSVHISVDGVFA